MTHIRKRRYAEVISLTERLTLAVSPVLVGFFILYFNGINLTYFSPFASDELHYWQEISGMHKEGFASGYSVINEMVARFSYSPFGAHGPGFPLLGALYAAVFGWSSYSPLIFNSLAIVISLWTLYVALAMDRTKRVLIALFLCSYLPLLMFLGTAMQETVQHGIGILVSMAIIGRFSRSDRTDERLPYIRNIGFVIAFMIFSLIRPTWGLLCFVVLVFAKNIIGGGFCGRMFLSFLVLAWSLVVLTYLCSPAVVAKQTTLVSEYLSGFDKRVLTEFLAHVEGNMATLFVSGGGTNSIETFYIHEAFFLVIYTGAMLFYYKAFSSPSGCNTQLYQASFLMLLASIVSMVLFYDVSEWRGFRHLAPVIISVTIMVIWISRHHVIVAGLIGAQVLTLPYFIPSFMSFRQYEFIGFTTEDKKLGEIIRKSLVYSPNENRWCNTFLLFTRGWQDNPTYRSLWNVDPGIGVSVIQRYDKLAFPLKSRYVFLTERTRAIMQEVGYPMESLSPYVNLGEIGLVYENRASGCASLTES